MKLQAVSNRKLYIQIADQIRDQIVDGIVHPGQQLPSERDLAIELGVSRPTVREALIALEVAGLVEVRIGVGAFVRGQRDTTAPLPELNHSPMEIMRARQLIEPEMAALAADNMDAAGKQHLKTVIETMRREHDAELWVAESDKLLHLAIAEGCGNAVLREMLAYLWASRGEQLDTRFHQHLASIDALRTHILEDHEHLVAAIGAGDARAARQAMEDHLAYVAAAMFSIWE